ncbi:hypothetical protein [Sphingomonas sp.]|uniref:hypothetical protein n=1 Tax=Sphingomonas sp. TaxID=28214 RepID=UPI000DB81AFD|nr:hypothetical protein [Sphingomonas sp.]PZU10276.1 MAG: hypothetical protein DI605_06770 [Sphingomonas sp.]
MSILTALRGIGGEYEIQRLLGAFGTVVYIVTAPALVWAQMVTVTFDTFCLAYPAGLAACIGASAGAIVLKDRGVAKAKAIEQGTPQ